ncbi:MAG: FAD-binding oxidoreductase [Gemmatimonadota bacterium]|nr:FAD-binding oxidoreductase [Gemmatimonadota bacterium]
MMSGAAVVVIGGGVIGASVAWHLARNGVRQVTILDRGHAPGNGSTGKATGGYRAQFATSINVRLSLISRESLLRFEEDTGVDPGYDPVGYLWLPSSQRELDALRAAQQVQHAAGLFEAEMLAPADIAKINADVSIDGIAGGAFCHTDGYIRPLEILRGYLDAAQELGAKLLWGSVVERMTLGTSGRIEIVHTTRGNFAADFVVNAAGAWAAGIAAMASVELPVTPLRRQVALTVPSRSLRQKTPLTIFMDTGFHYRVRDDRAMLCWPDPDLGTAPFVTSVDESWLARVDEMKRARIPALRDLDIDRQSCYAGLYEMSPDSHAIVGQAMECENLFLANGSSGHGVMHSPAIGRAVADMICGQTPALDLSALRPSRFAENDPIVSPELL